MANLNETLTIRIQGDSSDFNRELDQVTSRITDLESRLSGSDSASQRLGSSLQSLQRALQPLSQINQALERVKHQISTLSSTPVTLNVQPALNALKTLQAQIAATRGQLQALQGMSAAAGSFGGPSYSRYANGGVVQGRPGLDRIPAMLTAGEFVVRESSVNQLGVQFLNTLNEQGVHTSTRSVNDRSRLIANDQSIAPPASQTHFGGINIHVNQSSDLSHVMRELQAGGVRLRNRRG